MLTPAEWEALRLSLWVAGCAAFWGMAAAVPLAWIVARRRFPGRILFDALLHAPLILPPVVIGFVLLLVFGTQGPVGRWLGAIGVQLPFTSAGAALAAGVSCFPLMLRAVRLSIEGSIRSWRRRRGAWGRGRGTGRSRSCCRSPRRG